MDVSEATHGQPRESTCRSVPNFAVRQRLLKFFDALVGHLCFTEKQALKFGQPFQMLQSLVSNLRAKEIQVLKTIKEGESIHTASG